ncbi:MAG: DNA replication/repair protein RecF [Cyanobacteria bacterium J06633_2]
MYLKSLQLRHFRNYTDQFVAFTAPKTILVGENAQGKSNLLESVEVLATLRSHRASRDRDLVQEHHPVGQIDANLHRELSGLNRLTMTLRSSGRRTVALNGETMRRQLDFLGAMNAVQFSSLDIDLVRGGPGLRRTWLDTLLIQLEPIYAKLLTDYQSVLRQRNALIKQARANESVKELDRTQLAVWDAQLAATGTHVIRRRDRVIQRIAPLAQSWHSAISNSMETLDVVYAPNVSCSVDEPTQIKDAFLQKIQERAIAEFHQGTSLVGPHRDEVEFRINDTPARQFGSQGQQRTLVLALKLSELQLIEAVVGEPPLLLLDDVLAELDLNRQNQLLETIQDRFQTIITTTHLGAFDAQWLQSSQILTVKAGQLVI